MSKLLLIDGNAVLHRAYHALPPLSSRDGQPINAVYGFISMLLRLVTDLKPSHIAVAFDTPKPTFRHSEYVGYQAHRPRMHSDLGSQFQIVYAVLSAMQIPTYKLPGYEADDVIGTVACQAKEENEVVIVTGDRDILQLVDDNVKVYMPVRGLEGKLYGEEEVMERMKVAPYQIIDYKALAGDSSDNYPGVAGIGPKTASNLLTKYQTLENIYKHLDELPEKVAKKLAEGAEPAGIAKKLATIVCDAPITIHMNEAAKWDVDHSDALKLFEQLGFRTLTARIQKVGKEVDKEKQMKLI